MPETLLAAQPTCSASYRRGRPFRIDVFGPDAAADVQCAVKERLYLKDPIQSFKLRHLERDLFNSSVVPPSVVHSGENFTMLWPFSEMSYGDFWRDTMIPLGHLLDAGMLPATLAFSGLPTGSGALPQTNAVDGLAKIRSICTFERESPGIPRCAPMCYETIRLCEIREHGPVRGRLALSAMAALDTALGFPLPDFAAPSAAAVPGTLRVLFAARYARRFLVNQEELVAACNGLVLGGWALRCELRNLAQTRMKEVVALMRGVDVFISMHGGTVRCMRSVVYSQFYAPVPTVVISSTPPA